jgi:hypothetical protein
MTTRQPGSISLRDMLASAALAATMLVLTLDWFHGWLYGMEVFHALSMGLSYDPAAAPLLQLRAQALEYCERYAAPERLVECFHFQNVITERLAYAHPLTALIGLNVRGLIGRPDWLPDLQTVAAWAVLGPVLLALALWTLFTLAIPAERRGAVLAYTAVILLASQTRDNNHSVVPDLIAQAARWSAMYVIVGVLSLAGLILWARRVNGLAAMRRSLRWIDMSPSHIALAAAAVYAISLLAPSELNWLLQPGAWLLVLLTVLAAAQWRTDAGPLLLGLGLLAIAVTSDQFWYLRPVGPMRSLGALLFVSIIALATVRPKHPLLALMPVIAAFHVALAAQLSLVTFVIELALCVRRRAISHLLLAAALTFAISFAAVRLGVESPFLSPETTDLTRVVSSLLAWPGIASASAAVVLVLALSAAMLRYDDGLARSAMMIAAGLVIALLSIGLIEQNPALENAPGYALFAKSIHYLTAPLFGAGMMGLLLGLGSPAGPTSAHGSSGIPTPVLSALLLLMVVAKADLRPRDTVSDSAEIVGYVFLGHLHPSWCADLWQVRPDDDTYVLSTRNPVSASVNLLSALKMRMRMEAGSLRPEQIRIEPQQPNPAGCRES